MSEETTAPVRTDEAGVLADVTRMIGNVLEDQGGVDTEIGMDTHFTDELDMESIDMVALSTELTEHYGDRVNFAEFIAGFDVDEIIDMRVGTLVRYIVDSLAGS